MLNKYKIVVVLFIVILFFLACLKKEYSQEGGSPPGGGGGIEPPVNSEWEFKQEQKHYYGKVDTAYLTVENNKQSLVITGKSNTGNGKIFILLKDSDGVIRKGDQFRTSSSEVKFLYTSGNDTLYRAIPFYGGDLYVTVTEIDSNKVKGTFFGSAIDMANKTRELIEGKFSSPLKKIPVSLEKGYAMLWANEECNGPVKVKINDLPGEISIYSWITPDCGEAGRATYNLTAGTYRWVAYCGKDSLTGNVQVMPGNCSKVLVKFPYRPPDTTVTDVNCKLSAISYSGDLLNIMNEVTADCTGTVVNTLNYRVSPAPIPLPHPILYKGDSIIIDADNTLRRYFLKDAQGRVIAYRGSSDPTDYFSAIMLRITYQYDNNNQMVKRIVRNNYNMVLVDMSFTWQNGNIIKIVENYPLAAQTKEITYEYYMDKTVRQMPFVVESVVELLMFQPALNMGKQLRNPLKKISFTVIGGTITNFFSDYIIDNNGYVFNMSRIDNSGLRTDFVFNYNCF
ncbi:MAG: hypothetical protein H7Y00_02525 [Fimbriimonadaceae bacterium]|nr:hypothetical protein [Chitinophagales bacterium]